MSWKRLRALREDRGWTQLQLAKKLGTSRQHISRMECGHAVSEAFANAVEEILGDRPETEGGNDAFREPWLCSLDPSRPGGWSHIHECARIRALDAEAEQRWHKERVREVLMCIASGSYWGFQKARRFLAPPAGWKPPKKNASEHCVTVGVGVDT